MSAPVFLVRTIRVSRIPPLKAEQNKGRRSNSTVIYQGRSGVMITRENNLKSLIVLAALAGVLIIGSELVEANPISDIENKVQVGKLSTTDKDSNFLPADSPGDRRRVLPRLRPAPRTYRPTYKPAPTRDFTVIPLYQPPPPRTGALLEARATIATTGYLHWQNLRSIRKVLSLFA